MEHSSKNAVTKIAPEQDNAEILLEVESAAAIEWGVGRLRLLWDQRQFLFKTLGVGLVLGMLIAFLLPSEYQSYARLMPPDDQGGSGLAMLTSLAGKAGMGMAAGVGGDLLGLKTTGSLFIGILGSRTVQDDLINKFDLQKVYRESRLDKAREALEKHTTVVEDRKSGIITITVTDRNPQRARAMASEYVTGLNQVVTSVSTSSARREREFLEERLAGVKLDLEAAEKDFSQFSSKNGAIDIKEQGRAMVEAAAVLQGQLIAAESELKGLEQIYTDNNVRVRGARARIAELQDQLGKLGGKNDASGASTPGDFSMYPSIRKLPLLGVTYADLYRQTKVQEAVFETLTQEYELAKVREAKEVPSVKTLDPASTPEGRSFPPRMLIMALSVLLCGAASAGWVLGTAVWQRMDPGDPRKLFAREVFVTVGRQVPGSWTNGSGSRLEVKLLSRAGRNEDDERS